MKIYIQKYKCIIYNARNYHNILRTIIIFHRVAVPLVVELSVHVTLGVTWLTAGHSSRYSGPDSPCWLPRWWLDGRLSLHLPTVFLIKTRLQSKKSNWFESCDVPGWSGHPQDSPSDTDYVLSGPATHVNFLTGPTLTEVSHQLVTPSHLPWPWWVNIPTTSQTFHV